MVNKLNKPSLYSSPDFPKISACLINQEVMRKDRVKNFYFIAIFISVILLVALYLMLKYAEFGLAFISTFLFIGIGALSAYLLRMHYIDELNDIYSKKVYSAIVDIVWSNFKKSDKDTVKYMAEGGYVKTLPSTPFFYGNREGTSEMLVGEMNNIFFSSYNARFVRPDGKLEANSYAFVFDFPIHSDCTIVLSFSLPLYLKKIDPLGKMNAYDWNSLSVCTNDLNQAKKVMTPDMQTRITRFIELSKSRGWMPYVLIRHGKIEFYMPYLKYKFGIKHLFHPLTNLEVEGLYSFLFSNIQMIQEMTA